VFIAHARKVKSIKFQEICSGISRDTDKNVLFSPSKVPFVIDRSQPKLLYL